MKKLLSFALLLSSLSALGAKFEFTAPENLSSVKLKQLSEKAIKIQDKNATPNSDTFKLGTEGVKIILTEGQTEMKMVRQFLHAHFSCRGEIYVNAQRSHPAILGGVDDAFALEKMAKVPSYKKKVGEYRHDLMKLMLLDSIEVYDVDYNGGGACEYGKTGILILDRDISEAVFVYAGFSA